MKMVIVVIMLYALVKQIRAKFAIILTSSFKFDVYQGFRCYQLIDNNLYHEIYFLDNRFLTCLRYSLSDR
jgi:hypothetical protein